VSTFCSVNAIRVLAAVCRRCWTSLQVQSKDLSDGILHPEESIGRRKRFGRMASTQPLESRVMLSAGALDLSFGVDGRVSTAFDISAHGECVALQPDGKIVVAGRASRGASDVFAVARYNPDGSLDSTFDNDGKTTTQFGTDQGWATDVAIQADGKIVVLGFLSFNIAIARYNTDGSLDNSFDGDGKLTANLGGLPYAMAIQNDGKIVVSGEAYNGSNYDIAVVRFNANGSTDTSFDGDGKAVTDIGGLNQKAYDIAIQPDGKIVVGGYSEVNQASYGIRNSFALVRYNVNGTLDNSFGISGKMTSGVDYRNQMAYGIALQPDGKIIATGYIDDASGVGYGDPALKLVAVTRYTPSGTLDSTFGELFRDPTTRSGSQYFEIGGVSDTGWAVVLQDDGKILIAGTATIGGGVRFSVARLTNDGQLDSGHELWKYNASQLSPTLVKDINEGSSSSFPHAFVNAGGVAVFEADDGVNGEELWRSDGTESGTTLLKDIGLGELIGGVAELVQLNGQVLFRALSPDRYAWDLWRTDGTRAGTQMVKAAAGSNPVPRNLTAVGENVFFQWSDAQNSGFNYELWKTDGTTSGTTLVKEIRPGSSGSSPQNLVNVNGTLFFSANDSSGNELWRSDGTEAGTSMVKDIRPGSGSGLPRNMVNVNGTLFFTANNGTNGEELWKSDGTAIGTVMVKEIRTGSTWFALRNLTAVGDVLFFTADDGVNGEELWRSDGTPTGTTMVKNIRSGASSSFPQDLNVYESFVFFTANDAVNGAELWRSDGSSDGTVMVKDLAAGALSSTPRDLIVVSGLLYFVANDAVNGTELWKSDGTTSGTSIVLDGVVGNAGASPSNLANVDGTLFFSSGDGVNGFDGDGWVSTDFSEGTSSAYGAVLQVDGKLVVAGRVANSFGLARYDVTPSTSDYGDAPDTGDGTGLGNYQTLSGNSGPSHTCVSGLFLGVKVDGDAGTLQNIGADADDRFTVGGSDDEEGVLSPLDLQGTSGTQPTVTLSATNTTGRPADLFGWIDYNRDGVFDNATERAQFAIPSGTSFGRFTLTFPVIPVGYKGTTYARFRLSSDAAAADSVGSATDGEVEDYVFTMSAVVEQPITVKSFVKIANDTNGGPTLANFDSFAVATVPLGDLDGDGVGDIAVGAFYDDTGGLDRGAVHVLFLNIDGSVKSSKKIASGLNGGPILANGVFFGIGIATLGDLNGDGVTDIAVGAFNDDTGGQDRGAVHVLFLNTDGTVKSFMKIASGLNGCPILANGDLFGIGIAALGDLNGDGVTDIAVGAFNDDTGGQDRGAAHILFLNSDGSVKSSMKIGSGLNGGASLANFDAFGHSVSSLGDLDGDGVTDLAVGALLDDTGGPDRGAVHLLFMNSNGTVKIARKIASGVNGGPSLNNFDQFGGSLSQVGDMDGDGVTDLAVGARADDTNGLDRGSVYLLFLNRDGTVKSSAKIGSELNGGPALVNSDWFGGSVSSLGDLDGDGVDELAVGAFFDDTGGPDRGAVHVLFLKALNVSSPVFTSSANQNVAENTTAVVTVTATDADQPSQIVSFTITGGADATKFSITSGGVLTLVGPPDFEAPADNDANNTYIVEITATDSGSPALTTVQVITVTVGDVNETPLLTSGTTGAVPENAMISTVVYTAIASDLDTTAPHNTITFSIKDVDDAASVQINAATGDVTLLASADFESKTSYLFTVVATDGGSPVLSAEKSVTISVTNVNEAPTVISLTNSSLEENAAADFIVGTLSATDMDAGDTFTYSLVSGSGDTDNAAFTIDGNSLKASTFNFEAKSSYSIRVRTTDQGGLSFEKVFVVTVTNVNESPTGLTLSASSIAENLAVGTTVGTFTTTDPDAGDTFSYSFVSGSGDTDNAAFTIDGNSLKASTFNFEAKSSYSIRVRTTDQGGLSFEKVFVVTVTNVNESPTGLTLSASSIAENQAVGTTVGTFTTTDPDAGNTFVYSLATGTGSTDNAAFTITGNVLKTTVVLDFEVTPTRSIRVRTTDQGGRFFERVLTINIVNMLDGTAGSDSFVVTYTATNVSITLSVAGGPVVNQGVFPLTSPITISALTSIDSVKVIATSGHDIINVFASRIEVNASAVFVEGPAARIIAGGAGNDTYRFDADAVIGAVQLDESLSGIDVLDFSTTTTQGVTIDIGVSATQVVNSMLSLKLGSGLQFENIVGGSGNDTLTGNSLANTLTGNAGNDTLTGRSGDDSTVGGLGDDTYVFGAATTAEADTVTEVTNGGTDRLSFSSLTTDVIFSLGKSAIQTVHANRTLKLNAGNVFENINGGSGNDTLTGNSLANTLTGNAGNDMLTGGSGDDSMVGGLGDDTYVFGAATTAEADTVTEGPNGGTDTLNFNTLTTDVVLNLGTSLVQTMHSNRMVKLNSASTFENAIGGSGNDILTGNSLANSLTGNAGNDILVGNPGDDILSGGNGRDILIGGVGIDTLLGGNDDDILIAGRTTSDTVFTRLNDLRTEWVSSNPYATRTTNLRTGVGASTASLKAKVNVLTDTSAIDSLTGGGGTDWYFRALDDVITDLLATENIDVL
jgi:uncharacterized delta-60 repeat protein